MNRAYTKRDSTEKIRRDRDKNLIRKKKHTLAMVFHGQEGSQRYETFALRNKGFELNIRHLNL